MATSTLLLLLLLPISSSSLSLSPAIDALASSPNFTSIALTLTLTRRTLIPPSLRYLTIFSPDDAEFAASGQPPLSLLRCHLSPERITGKTLDSLAFGSKIRTLDPDRQLIATKSPSDCRISINGVGINGSAAFDDGSVIVYGIDRFFDPSFDLLPPPGPPLSSPVPTFKCTAPASTRSFTKASNKIRSIGYSLIASFLDSQLFWNQNITIFAPLDKSLKQFGWNFSNVGVFRRHVVPCRIGGADLKGLAVGTVLPTLDEAFEIRVDQSDGRVLLNGVQVEVSDLYGDELLVVHGVGDVLQPLDTSLEFG